MFLTDAELTELTGYKRPSGQVNWLRSNGLRFFIARNGHPRILRSDLEAKGQTRANGPDFSIFNKAG